MKALATSMMALAVMTACGTKDDARKEQPTTSAPVGLASAEEAQAAQAQLPAGVIVRIPVIGGVEQTDAMTTAQLPAGATLATEDGLAAAFNGATPVTVADELDRDSSSQQWGNTSFYWNTPWYPGKLLGRGLTWGNNPYAYYGGRSYQYNYYNGYSNYGGYNYYQYQPYGCGGNGGGYGNGYGNGYYY